MPADVVMQRAEIGAAQIARVAVARDGAAAGDQVLQIVKRVVANRDDAAGEQAQREAVEPGGDVVVELRVVVAVVQRNKRGHGR